MSDIHKKITTESKQQIELFLEKTIDYALRHIEKISEIEKYPVAERNVRLQRLQAWQSYVEFQQHTLRELRAGKLDGWFG